MDDLTRRRFTRLAGAATALSYARILGANDRVRMGYVGLGNRGDQVHDAFLEHGDNVTVAVCDLRQDYMDFAVKKSRTNPRIYSSKKAVIQPKSANIPHKTKSYLEWDAREERFTNNEAANRYLYYKYRAPYKLG